MRAVAWVLPVLALGLGACGGLSDRERFELRTPGTDDPIVREIAGSEKLRRGEPTKAEVKVIRAWSDALRAGHVAEAADLFAIPAWVTDEFNAQHRLGDRAAIRAFNRGLTCGSKLLDVQRGAPSYVVATFRLTQRPGADCGAGVGKRSDVVFLVERRHIVELRRGLPAVSQSSGG